MKKQRRLVQLRIWSTSRTHVRNKSRPHTCLGIQVNCTTNNLLMILQNFHIIKFIPSKNTRKPKGFLFSGGIDKQHRAVMG